MGSRLAQEHGTHDVHLWGRWEEIFFSKRDITDPVHSVQLSVDLTAPSGGRHTASGFWDGSDTWRVRFSPSETGSWSYVTRSTPRLGGLDGESGRFECLPYHGENPLYRHGAIRLAPSRRYLEHSDGTPFFYLADTAWNGPLLSTAEEWDHYLSDRMAKKFTAVQYITTQFRGMAADRDGHVAFTGVDHISMYVLFTPMHAYPRHL